MLGNIDAISVEKGKQAFAILFYLTFFLMSGPLTLTTLIYLLFWTKYWWVTLAYVTWWVWDVQTCNTGPRNRYSDVVTIFTVTFYSRWEERLPCSLGEGLEVVEVVQ